VARYPHKLNASLIGLLAIICSPPAEPRPVPPSSTSAEGMDEH
jgi:hypothetical protein